MRLKYIMSSLLLLVALLSNAQTKIIEYPDFESSSSTSFEINKLELSDTETVLYCDVYNRSGYWNQISSKSYLIGNSGQRYKLLRSEGFELDKKIAMPQSGNRSFKLIMEPLKKNETSFDFTEGETIEGAYVVKGIKTTKFKSSAPVRCLLKGEVVDRPFSSRLVLTKESGDERVCAIYIPIRNGQFEYELNGDHVESYSLAFYDEMMNGGWRPITFFSDSSTISFKLHPKDKYHLNSVEGGELNKEYSNYLTIRDSLTHRLELEKQYKDLKEAGKVDSEEIKHLNKQIEKTEGRAEKDSLYKIMSKMYDSGAAFTSEYKEWRKKGEGLYSKFSNWEMNYLKEKSSILSYSLLLNKLISALQRSKNEDIPQITELFNSVYASKYPEHPYTRQVNNMLHSYASMKVGGKYIDFTAPDFNGKPVKLSEQIDGQVALVDLWASWCGPCRRSAMSMIPVYEAYKNKGFTVIGVARERNLSAAVNAAKKDHYPWLNLIELQDAGKIWEKYGLGNSGGSSFLIDKDGTILAIRPKAEEVEKILSRLLD